MRSDPGRRHPTTVERRCHVLPGGGDIGRAVAKVYAYARVDYPGGAQSLVFDTDGTTTVGGFVFHPGSATSPTTVFTFAGGAYQTPPVPGSTVSVATGINAAGLIVGVYVDLAGVGRGFCK
jgi:hypothetical protein